jgi:hypothetical protein
VVAGCLEVVCLCVLKRDLFVVVGLSGAAGSSDVDFFVVGDVCPIELCRVECFPVECFAVECFPVECFPVECFQVTDSSLVATLSEIECLRVDSLCVVLACLVCEMFVLVRLSVAAGLPLVRRLADMASLPTPDW